MASLLMPANALAATSDSVHSWWFLLGAVPLCWFLLARSRMHVTGTLVGLWMIVLWNHVDHTLISGAPLSGIELLQSVGALSIVTMVAMSVVTAGPGRTSARSGRGIRLSLASMLGL